MTSEVFFDGKFWFCSTICLLVFFSDVFVCIAGYQFKICDLLRFAERTDEQMHVLSKKKNRKTETKLTVGILKQVQNTQKG